MFLNSLICFPHEIREYENFANITRSSLYPVQEVYRVQEVWKSKKISDLKLNRTNLLQFQCVERFQS